MWEEDASLVRARQALKSHPDVRRELMRWWATYEKSEDGQGVERDEFVYVHMCMQVRAGGPVAWGALKGSSCDATSLQSRHARPCATRHALHAATRLASIATWRCAALQLGTVDRVW